MVAVICGVPASALITTYGRKVRLPLDVSSLKAMYFIKKSINSEHKLYKKTTYKGEMNGVDEEQTDNNEGALKRQQPVARPRTRVANRHQTKTDAAMSSNEETSTPQKKKDGWGEASSTTTNKTSGGTGLLGKLFRGDRSKEEEKIDYKGEIPKYTDDEDSDENTPAIPTLDGGEVDEVTGEVAHAPDYMAFKVQSISELDKDIAFSLPPLRHLEDENIDLGILTSVLAPADQIVEDDVQWTRLTFTQLLHGELF